MELEITHTHLFYEHSYLTTFIKLSERKLNGVIESPLSLHFTRKIYNYRVELQQKKNKTPVKMWKMHAYIKRIVEEVSFY